MIPRPAGHRSGFERRSEKGRRNGLNSRGEEEKRRIGERRLGLIVDQARIVDHVPKTTRRNSYKGRLASLAGSLREGLMRRIVLAVLIACYAAGTAAAQSCEDKAMSANGKPLHGAAKMSFVKKCKRDACASKAVSAEGKPLHGAAKNSFVAKCMKGA